MGRRVFTIAIAGANRFIDKRHGWGRTFGGNQNG